MTPRRRRMWTIGLLVAGMALATGLILKSFEENLMYFYSPGDIAAGKAPASRNFRIGGMVVKGSVKRDTASLAVNFTLTDYAHETVVTYNGILPDLFREGQGIVANGHLNPQGIFAADEVLAKHDEKYMPPEVAASLKTPKTASNTP